MRPLASVSGTRCTRCPPLSYWSWRVDAFPFEAEDDFLEAAQLGRVHVEDLDLPAAVLGVVLVHVVEVAGEQGRFLAAGAGADLHHAAAAIGVLAADGQVQKLVPEPFALAP